MPDFRTRMGHCALPIALSASLLGLSGCAAPVMGALTAGEVLSLAGLGSAIMTGRDLGEHALSLVTGKDCRVLETLLRDGRSFCETPGSAASRDDFPGVIALLGEEAKPGETEIAAASLDPRLLGFAPIERSGAEDFSLAIAARKNAGEENAPLFFGMLSASFGQSWPYEVSRATAATPAPATTPATTPARLASADEAATAAQESSPPLLRPSHAEYSGL